MRCRYLTKTNASVEKLNQLCSTPQTTLILANAAGRVEQTTKFDVLVRPTITSFQNISTEIRRESRFECRVTGEPRPNITIRKDGNTRPFIIGDPRVGIEKLNDNEETVLILTIANTERKDDGLYYCAAENGYAP